MIANPFAKPPSDLQVLAGHVLTATRLVASYPGRIPSQWPPDERDFLLAVCEHILDAMRQDAALITLAAEAVYLDPTRTPDHFAEACRLPAHLEELTLIATGATLLLHLDAHGDTASHRPVAATTFQRAICLADWQRARLTPPPKPPMPPLPDVTAQAATNTPMMPAATVLAALPAPQLISVATVPNTGNLPPPATVEMDNDDPATRAAQPTMAPIRQPHRWTQRNACVPSWNATRPSTQSSR